MAIAEKRSYSVDLQKGAEHAVLRAPLATMDNLAHIFEVQVNDGGAAADLSGAACEAYFVRADGVTVMLDGVISGSTASVTLGANCYAVPGRFELAVKLKKGEIVHTILRVEGSVTTSRTDAMTGAGSGVHSLDQLEEKITAAVNGLYQRDRVRNLLDNSDFRNPVNQRGATTYTAAGYTIDRWIASAAQPVSLTADGIKLDGTNSAIVLRQRFSSLQDGVYTIAVKANGHVAVRQYRKSGTTYTKEYENDSYSGGYITMLNNAYPEVQVRANAGSVVTVEWAALYPGAYTAETLPAYVPKGYAAELLECQRYYRQYSTIQFPITFSSESYGRVAIDYTTMRATPAVDANVAGIYIDATLYTGVESVAASSKPASEVTISTTQTIAARKTGTVRFNSLALSAEL